MDKLRKKAEPTFEQKKYCETSLVLEAYIETVKPKIEDIYNNVLDYWFPENSLKDRYTGETITEYKNLHRYDGSLSDFDSYYKEVARVLKEKGFAPEKEGCCPLLEAEDRLRKTQVLFVKACCDALPENVDLSYKDLANASFKHWKEFIEINTKYVIQFIDIDKLKEKLK